MDLAQYYNVDTYKHRIKQDPRDVFEFEHPCPHLWNEYWFDKHGNSIAREANDSFPPNVAFVVTEDGEVMATQMPEWGIATFVNPETKLPDLAAAKPVRFFVQNGKTQVEYAWLKCDQEIQNSALTMPNVILEEKSSLPLTSFDGHLRHYTDIDMPNSSNTLPILRRWLRGREHREVGSWTASETKQPTFVGIDIYDALEFYFVHSANRMWRTRIGELVWTIVKPYVWNQVTVQHLLNIRRWRPVLSKHSGVCDFCAKPHVALFRVQWAHWDLLFDQRCIAYAHRFQQLGRFVRNLRTKEQFSPTFVAKITRFLEKLSQTFI